jgi:flavodoxin
MKIAVFIYSQSGQAKEAAKKIFDVCKQGKEDAHEDTIIFKTIIPEQEYPFPWSKK